MQLGLPALALVEVAAAVARRHLAALPTDQRAGKIKRELGERAHLVVGHLGGRGIVVRADLVANPGRAVNPREIGLERDRLAGAFDVQHFFEFAVERARQFDQGVVVIRFARQ